MPDLASSRLYTFIDTAYLHARKPAELAQQLCDGGADLLQIRAKTSTPVEIENLAREILPVTRAAGVLLVINDHPEIAAKLDADLCHLGQEDFFDAGYTHVSELHRKYSGTRLGLSTHSPAQALRAVAAEPDYVAIGPVYATGTKPSANPVTLDYVHWAAAHLTLPWFAIGGINLNNLDDVLAAGATRICVVSAILNAPDVAAACRAFKSRLA